LKLFFRSENLPFTVESKAVPPPGLVNYSPFKTYDHFSDVCRDFVDVRIYQGIHFRTADETAFRAGRQSADWTVSHILKPR